MSFFWKTYLSTVIFWFYVNETYLTTVIFWLRKCFILFHNKLNWIALIFRKYFDFQNLLLNSSFKIYIKMENCVGDGSIFSTHDRGTVFNFESESGIHFKQEIVWFAETIPNIWVIPDRNSKILFHRVGYT